MAATLTKERFAGPEWIFERKLDGIRVLAYKRGDDVRLFSRNQLPLNGSYPAVVEAVARLPVRDVILDGEATGGWGRLGRGDYHVFDILWRDGKDLTSLPLDERRAILNNLPLRLPLERVKALDDPKPWERACADGWEGVIAKRRDSKYEHRRSPHWLKMKCEATQELVIGGFTDPQGARVGLGALLVGYYDDAARSPGPATKGGGPATKAGGRATKASGRATTDPAFVFAGKVGTGFDTKLLRDLRARLDRLEIPSSPFTGGTGLPKLRVHWVTPEIVVQVAFIEWTPYDKLRHPRLLGIRPDKTARDVVRETPS
jgi:bifunctional non-homologous end joining protein LigD